MRQSNNWKKLSSCCEAGFDIAKFPINEDMIEVRLAILAFRRPHADWKLKRVIT